jgi:hypothetical protein
MTLDGLRSDQIWDFCEFQGNLSPGAGETFRAEWRVLIDAVGDPFDVGVVITRDAPPGDVLLKLAPAELWIRNDDIFIQLEPGVFHDYVFTSPDMQSYTLTIDGTIQYQSFFDPETNLNNFVNFGDGVQGGRRARIGTTSASVWFQSLGLLCFLRRLY